MPQSEPLLDKVLRQESDPRMRERILRIVNATGLDEKDPAFLLMLGTGRVQALIEDAPNQIRQTYKQLNQDLDRKLDGYEQAARRGVERNIAEAAQDAIAKTGASKAQLNAKALAGGGAVALLLIGLGILGGFAWFKATTRIAPGGAVQLTQEQAEALDWAMSEEGRYAQKIMQWNESLLGGECQQQVEGFVESEGLTLQYGAQKAISGFCLVWIVPPEDREFIQAQE